jgi:hypothetical protein
MEGRGGEDESAESPGEEPEEEEEFVHGMRELYLIQFMAHGL